MWGNKSRLQPSRPPPPFDPFVEAWLESLPLPAVKPSRKELRQWKLTDYHGLGKSVFVTCLILRAASLVVALTVTVLTASVVARRPAVREAHERLVPCLVVCPMVALWNIAEFAVAYVVRDGGLSPNFHVVVDSLLFVGVATAMGTLLVDVICGVTEFGASFSSASEEIACVCFLVALMVIHSFLLFFFVCNFVENKRRQLQPRVTHRAVVPHYAQAARYGPHAGLSGEGIQPPAARDALKRGPMMTAIEMDEFRVSRQHHHGFGTVSPPLATPAIHETTTANSLAADAGASERAAVAQAMSGLWDVGGKPSYQHGPPRVGDGEEEEEGELGVDARPAPEQPPPLPAKIRYM
ncbi:hypothetical protein VTJ83DRAFT_3770 [Remersonia thermophila]|uniref:Uncharacterized protein n=1 Tax=Remersonia thermophila TaxID=72144 RepID=A0ABR4DFV5_9PEZI